MLIVPFFKIADMPAIDYLTVLFEFAADTRGHIVVNAELGKAAASERAGQKAIGGDHAVYRFVHIVEVAHQRELAERIGDALHSRFYRRSAGGTVYQVAHRTRAGMEDGLQPDGHF